MATGLDRPRLDIKQLNALVAAIPRIRGNRGRPLRKPGIVQGDREYSYNKHRQALRKQGIVPELAGIGAPNRSGPGKTRWVVERSIAKIRYERHDYIHEAFFSLARALICWNKLKKP